MQHMKKIFSNGKRYSKGSGMVEILIASGIISVVIMTIINVYSSLASISLLNTDKVQASFLLEEGAEAVRLLRDTSWSNISSLTASTTTYYLYWPVAATSTSATWRATTTPQLVDEMRRSFKVYTVSRDSNFDIVTSGGSNDAGSRRVVITVAWPTLYGTTTKSLEMYIFNTFNN